ncbi:MAG: hypothetical protein HOA61_03215, partial [Bacteroidetes bacterium]|nr:hypothetical protein [Bacteroidota bacterium]
MYTIEQLNFLKKADLNEIAKEVGVTYYTRMKKEELIEKILAKKTGAETKDEKKTVEPETKEVQKTEVKNEEPSKEELINSFVKEEAAQTREPKPAKEIIKKEEPKKIQHEPKGQDDRPNRG